MTEAIAKQEPDATGAIIPFGEYLDSPEVNNGWLREMAKSALHFRTYKKRTKKDTAPKKIGRPIHTCTLEPERFEDSIVTWIGGLTKKGEPTTSHNSSDYKDLVLAATAEGKEVLDEADVKICHSVRRAVWDHPEAGKLVRNARSEVSVFWTHRFGMRLKMRADLLNEDRFLADLKSTIDPTFDSFGKSANRFEYHCQLAMYQDGAEALTGKKLPVYIIAAEKEAPFDVVVYEVPEVALELGRSIYEDRLLKVKKCRDSGIWPGICQGISTLELPNWAYQEPTFIDQIPAPNGKGDISAL